jgi:hypothetical protein
MKAGSRVLVIAALAAMFGLTACMSAMAQEQSRESMAVDATASQWSFQFAYEGFSDYKDDSLDTDGGKVVRPEGNKGFLQFRMVAPISKSQSMPLTLLPRLTLRAVQNAAGDYGFAQSDLFCLGIINQWAKGRWGLGPQINFPAQSSEFGNTNWGFGLAGAVTQRELDDKLYLALLLQQTWAKKMDGSGDYGSSPLAINAIIVYQLGGGWYISNGDYVIRYHWDASAWLIPFHVRLGKAFVGDTSTWNAYIEYATPVYYDDWPGAVAGNTLRLNIQYQIPVGG